MKKTFLFSSLIVFIMLMGLMSALPIKAETFQKIETGHVLMYYPGQWNVDINKNYAGPIGKYTGVPLLSVSSPNWIPPFPDNGQVTIDVVQYKSGGETLKNWFRKYWKRSYENSEKSYTKKKLKGKRVFTNNRIYKIYIKDLNPEEGNPGIQKKLFVKREKNIYEVSLLHVGITRDDNWNNAQDIIKSMSIY